MTRRASQSGPAASEPANGHLDPRLGAPHDLFRRMTSARFEALTQWGLPVALRHETRLASAWALPDERVLIGVLHLNPTREFLCVALARDDQGRYRGVERSVMFPSARAAEAAIARDFGKRLAAEDPAFSGLAGQPDGVDLFTPAAGKTRVHEAFVMLRDGFNQAAAKGMLTEIARWFPDLDGHFAKEFQTAGYSARIWELYLWSALRALDFVIDYAAAVPDFALSKSGQRVFVEATTVSAPDPYAAAMAPGVPPDPPWPLVTHLQHDMARKVGSPLYSKLTKRGWTPPHVAGHPYVLALADFHAPGSMRWSHEAFPLYLYGLRLLLTPDCDNQLTELWVPGEDHVVGAKRVPTNFFAQPDAENVSAVLFSNAGTVSKFNRMGVRAGFGDAWVSLVREGVLTDPEDPGISQKRFKVDVEDPAYSEGWADELVVYHNPNARHPLDQALFPGVCHVQIVDGAYVASGPVRTLWSITRSIDFLERTAGRPSWAMPTA